MASDDSAYKDDVAPEGSPFRPLYDDRIWFNGQPIALVVAEEPEIARFAASLVAVEYTQEPHATDHDRRVTRRSRWRPAIRQSVRAAEAAGRSGCRRSPPPRCATKASITCRSSTTIRWSSTPRR